MTIEQPTTDSTPAEQPRARRVDLSATQVVASALAAITATVAASYLGVSGTVIGAAVASVLTVIGNAVYSHSLRTTGNRVRVTTGRAPRPVPPASDTQPPVLPDERARAANPVWRRLAFGTVAVFTTVLTVVTGVELVAGRPISDLVRGQGGSGTTLFDGNETKQSTPTPKPITVTQTVTADVVVTTPTVTQTATPVTETVTPTTTRTATTTPSTPTSTPTSSPGTGTSQPAAP